MSVWKQEGWGHTVDSYSHDLSQDEAVLTNERWNTIQGVKLKVFGVGVRRTGLDELDVEVVRFPNCEKDS